MGPRYDQKLVRACLAAVARRAGADLVVGFREIEAEEERPADLDLVIDGDARCVRICVQEVRS